jgi:uncharacterized membrane protein YdfJ with MMPL/SSD domain
MFSRLASLIDRHPWRVLAAVLGIVAIAAPFGLHVRNDLKPRGFDVSDSSSARARELVAETTGTDPANSVLALVRLGAPIGTTGSRQTIFARARQTSCRPAPAETDSRLFR